MTIMKQVKAQAVNDSDRALLLRCIKELIEGPRAPQSRLKLGGNGACVCDDKLRYPRVVICHDSAEQRLCKRSIAYKKG